MIAPGRRAFPRRVRISERRPRGETILPRCTAGASNARRIIVVGTDFSRGADVAVERAIRIATASHAVLHVVHASSRLPRSIVEAFRARRERFFEGDALARIVTRLARAETVRRRPARALASSWRSAARDLA